MKKLILVCSLLLNNTQLFAMDYMHLDSLKTVGLITAGSTIVGLTSRYYFQPWCKDNVELHRATFEKFNPLIAQYNSSLGADKKQIQLMEEIKPGEKSGDYWNHLHANVPYNDLYSVAPAPDFTTLFIHPHPLNFPHVAWHDALACSWWYKKHTIIQTASFSIFLASLGGLAYIHYFARTNK